MLCAGDEFGNSQNGNNNAYAQDNEISWLNWDRAKPEGSDLLNFVRKLIVLRKKYPILHRGRFLTAAYNAELDVKDVMWLAPSGTEMTEELWHDENQRCLGIQLDGRAQPSGIKQLGSDATLLWIVNAHHESVPFVLPEVVRGTQWLGLVDTHSPSNVEPRPFRFNFVYPVAGRSLALFVLDAPDRPQRNLREGIAALLDVAETPIREIT
jgi:glycogen operon protein